MNFRPQDTNILIIDDDLHNCEIFYAYLKKAGFMPHIASSAVEGLDKVQAIQPQLILLDVKMPHMDGFEVCTELKKDTSTKDIPVIFLTGLTDTKTMAKAFEVGAVDYIAKPVRRVELIARVTNHLEMYRYRHHLEELVAQRTAELQQHREQLEAVVIENIVNAIPSVLISIDSECLITKWNRQAEQKTGICANEVIGKKLEEALPYFSRHIDSIKGAIKEQRLFKGRAEHVKQDAAEYQDVIVYPLSADSSGGAVIKIDPGIHHGMKEPEDIPYS
ncbi:MAG: response regulator [Deltaproteobacteria bacterium]|nr:response regulator [Deltaproteobacteria bacterium]MBN2671430.1 response regulator [Deltaproteobacteria bacterium]